jgi:hypothetical protein
MLLSFFQNRISPFFNKKQGHSFLDCRFASQIDKERITSRLNQNNYTGHQQI